MGRNLNELEQKIGYQFKDISLLKRAMTHSSSANELHLPKYECNERLEFLGDAVLELICSEFLFYNENIMQEGDLTRWRASVVCESSLAFCARQIHLGDFLLLGKGEEYTGGRERDSVTSDAMEALIGAIYIDGGYEKASRFVNRFVLNDLDKRKLFYDSKTVLQEFVQANFHETVSYRLIGEEGPDHNKSFRSAVYIGGEQYGTGTGRTKKAAEQEAAYRTILKLQKINL